MSMKWMMVLVLGFGIVMPIMAQGTGTRYPESRKSDHVDTYFGVKVPDPYRWLEDDNATATLEWGDEQNKVTNAYLEGISFRNDLKNRLEKIYNYPKYSAPTQKGNRFFFSKNDGLQNQSVVYVQDGLDGRPEVLLDPNTLSKDGTVQLKNAAVSKNGRYWAYALSEGGSDWQEILVLDLETRKPLPDRVKWVKVSGLAWKGDGFYYSRYDQPVGSSKGLSEKNENHRVYYHALGTEQSADQLVFEDAQHPQRFHMVATTEDERFLCLYVSDRGTGKKGNALFVRDLTGSATAFVPIVSEFDDIFSAVDNVDDSLLVFTNKNAPNGRVLRVNTKDPTEKTWQEVIPEKPEPLDSVETACGKLFATYMKDVAHRVYVHDLAGKLEHEIALPALGTAVGFSGERTSPFLFYTFTSFTFPPTIYKYTTASQTSELFRASEVAFSPDDFTVEQVFYPSADGTKIPMFLVYKKGLKREGHNPTLLYGYGGFNISLNPSFNPFHIAWLEQGGIYAVANLRGGGEYGEKWHEAGMKLSKENVFADFIAAAEWLIAQKYTSTPKLAIYGHSNGGLLVGAAMTKRPELFKAAVPAVGVMDMLRFQKFTIGWNWIADYASSDDDEKTFRYLLGYSPLHTLKDGVAYPATLVTTADHDDRVVPAHSFKFAATLQEKHKGEAPVLIRIAKKSGHGASNTTKRIEEMADIFAFLFDQLGVKPVFGGDAAPAAK
jgi:prolyl oligopeptidase